MGAAFALLAASLYTERWYHWAGVALLLAAWAPWRTYPSNALGILVGLYCAWLLGNAVFVTPVYSAESLYQPLMLFGAFAAVAAAGRPSWNVMFRAGTALCAVLVMVGFVQFFSGAWYVNDVPHRASGTFMTPNTFGTALNMFLAPVAVLYLRSGSRRLLALAAWLFAGVVSTESRGAMLALIAGLGYVALAAWPGDWRLALRRATALLVAFAASGLLVIGAAHAVLRGGSGPADTAAAAAAPTAATWLARPTWDRSDLFTATIGLILEHPIAGSGANMFFPLFERVKPDSLNDADWFYAHCDYLQVWLEFGAPGLLMLLAIVIVSLVVAQRAFRRDRADPLPLACGAALATCFAHAMVDFPLYVPFTLMLAGAFLGALARHWQRTVARNPAASGESRIGASFTPVLRGALVVAALGWLAQPVIAEIASIHSTALLGRGDVSRALYWRTVAERFEPRHPAHYWAEAMIWRAQLSLKPDPLFAAEADALFLKGMKANPYDAASLMGRAQLHRRYAALLEHPATREEILAWAKRAVELRPQNSTVQAQYALALADVGRRDEARALAQALSDKFPSSEAVRRLAREL